MEQQPTDAWEDGIRHCTRRGYEVPSDTTADQKVGEGSEGGFLYQTGGFFWDGFFEARAKIKFGDAGLSLCNRVWRGRWFVRCDHRLQTLHGVKPRVAVSDSLKHGACFKRDGRHWESIFFAISSILVFMALNPMHAGQSVLGQGYSLYHHFSGHKFTAKDQITSRISSPTHQALLEALGARVRARPQHAPTQLSLCLPL